MHKRGGQHIEVLAMKGILIAEFIDLMEAEFGADMVDTVLEEVKPASGGVYTSMGTYDHAELVAILMALSRHSKVPLANLNKTFGMYYFPEFIASHPDLFDSHNSSLALLENIEWLIQWEAQRLYPSAIPPKVVCSRTSPTSLELFHEGPKCLGDVAEGLIHGCAFHYGEKIMVRRESLNESSGPGEWFLLTLDRTSVTLKARH